MTQTRTKQSIWIVRYGLTKFPLLENVGPFDSPLDPQEGVDHAKQIGHRIRQEILEDAEESNEEIDRTCVYASPFVRTTQTAQLIALDLPGDSVVCIEEGLTEWRQKSLLVDPNGVRTLPKTKKQLAETYTTINVEYDSVCPPSNDSMDPNGSSMSEETEEMLFIRCSETIQSIIRHAGQKSFVIVSHAPCDQALAISLEGKYLEDSKLGPWPLGGVTRFSRDIYQGGTFGPWNLIYYGDTTHMPGIYKPGIKSWSLPTLEKRQISLGNGGAPV